MSYVPTEEDLKLYEEPEPSLAHSMKDYLQGYGSQLLQSGGEGLRHVAKLPSYAYEAATDKPLYDIPKPDFLKYVPESEAGQTGKHVGETVSDIAAAIIPGRLGIRGLRALMRYHPLTTGQMGRQIRRPINEANEAGVRAPLSHREIYELNELLSHPELARGGATGKSLTPMGIQSMLEGATEGRMDPLFSAQSRMGDLERVLPRLGERDLAARRVRPMKERILEEMQQQMRASGLEPQADELQYAREAARRHFRTKENIRRVGKAVGKPLSLAALLRAAITGVKHLP